MEKRTHSHVFSGLTNIHYFSLIFHFMMQFPVSLEMGTPSSCTIPGSSCSAYLFYPLPFGMTSQYAETLFGIKSEDIFTENTSDPTPVQSTRDLYIRVNCSCSSSRQYFAYSSFLVENKSVTLGSIAQGVYDGLAWTGQENDSTQVFSAGQTAPISLLCECSRPGAKWKYVLSYKIVANDNVDNLVTRFKSEVAAISAANPDIKDVSVIFPDMVMYIPINSDILQFYRRSTMLLNPSSSEKEKLSSGVIVAVIVSTSIFLLVGLAVLYLKLTKSNFSHHIKTDEATKISSSGGSTGLLNFARCSSLLQERMGLGRNPSMNENAKRCITISKDIMSDVLYFERPVKFNFDEINNATNNFSSKILGQGSYGTVYHGMLRDQDVSIKEIGARKTPEFVAEIKSLCKLHHANLVELIGYSSNENDVYLVYEYVENGALDDHLHHFLEKGLTPLTWNSRMQIALDAARGLEYIHEHTKVHYVHCAVKTSNILLDSYFRAKVADFGLQKLMEMTKQFEALDICVVEKRVSDTSKCHQTGLLSTKSDVYSFGMVLIELITGQKAVSKVMATTPNTKRDQPQTQGVLAAFEDRLSPMHTKILHELADLSLLNVYPNHLFYKVCELAKQCLQKDAKCRPDMREIVYCLSQIALQSIEWEATLSGGSQIFSRITQGR